jgi:hypothetical protein
MGYKLERGGSGNQYSGDDEQEQDLAHKRLRADNESPSSPYDAPATAACA